MPRTSETRFAKLESLPTNIQTEKLTCWNFRAEAKFIDIEDFRGEAELPTGDVIFFRKDMLLSVSDFVIDDLTWRCRNFIFTEKKMTLLMFSLNLKQTNSPDNQHICVHLIAQAFLCIWLKSESNTSNTFEQADKAENHD